MKPNSVRRSRRTFQPSLSNQQLRSEHRDHLISDYLSELDAPRALTVWLLYKSGEHRQLVQLECNPEHYNNVHRFRAAYAATKFLSKCVGLKTGINLKDVALQSAEEAERVNRSTNATIVAIREGHASDLYGSEIYRAIQKIANILGPCPRDFEDVGWSTGRSSSSYGEHVTGYHKYQSRPDVTVRARARALRLLRESPWWGASILKCDAPVSILPSVLTTIGGNTLITVPKSAKTDRVICYEPHMNIRLQLAVGEYLKSRLKRAGINLRDQSINRRRAKLASKTGSMATLDLSSASDTIALELVYELLPIDWACLLDDLRSPNTLWPDGSTRRCEKFSSMGNGFTFELESLIFYALASAITENVSVYGDDIIVPTSAYGEVTRLLTACGFKLNSKKSFSTGYFRESCGGDYFSGVDCTPVYLRRLPKTTEDVIKLHNQVRRFASVTRERSWANLLKKWRTIHPGHLGPERDQGRDLYVFTKDLRVLKRLSAFNVLTLDHRLIGFLRDLTEDADENQLGDGHYHVNWDECSPRAARNWSTDGIRKDYTGIEGWVYRTRVRYVESEVSLENYASAICVGTGPKRTLNLLSSAYKRMAKYKDMWGLASVWPDICWG